MNILILSEDIPFEVVRKKGITAVNVQLFLIARELSEMGNQVGFLSVVRGDKYASARRAVDPEIVAAGREGGFSILSPVVYPGRMTAAGQAGTRELLARLAKAATGAISIREFYPSIDLGGEITERADAFGADVIFAFVSPNAAGAMSGVTSYPKIIFQGNIDFVTDQLRFEHESLFAIPNAEGRRGIRGRVSRYIRKKYVESFEAAHRTVSLSADAIANTAKCNDLYYRQIGHPRSSYVGTTWTNHPRDRVSERTAARRDGSPEKPFKIIGHIGFLNMTASTFGLDFLLREVMPALRQVMQGYAFEVHVIGDGAPVAPLQPYLQQENLVLGGYVEDLDSALFDSDVFLFLNNVGPLKAIFSRQIMAWSMGLCLIAHEGSGKALPELAHGENALVGDSPEEIAKLVRQACLDRELNRRIRCGGRQIYEEIFSPGALSEKLFAIMSDLVASFTRSG
jgi:glycosyltransferase involved in cell wall biosynthesis